MKNDIDDILNSMFKSGELNLKRAQKNSAEAQKTLDGVEKVNAAFSSSLQSDIEKLTENAQNSMDELELRLKNDGVDAPKRGLLSSREAGEAVTKTKAILSETVIGQDNFIDELVRTFKRPIVAGYPSSMPKARAVISGGEGTGRHTALRAMTEELSKLKVLSSGGVETIDLSRYSEAGSDRMFIQDFFSAIESKSEVIAFDNFDKCHTSVITMLSSLFSSGKVVLPGRYAKQKGMLVDIGTALVPDAVSEISAADRYLFLITTAGEKKLTDVFGAPFVAGLDDICKTGLPDDESLNKIARAKLDGLCGKCREMLGYEITFGDAEVAELKKEFSTEDGAQAIEKHVELLYRRISEDKLTSGRKEASGQLKADEDGLAVFIDGKRIELEEQRGEAEAIAQIKQELMELVGLKTVKEYVLSLEDNFKVQQMRKEKGMKADFPSMHMIFTGNPGTGKTTVARLVSRYLKAIGVLSGGQLVEVTRADLVGKYVGHTAPLTQKAIHSAIGGVLFIDEAYSLFRGNDDSFGLECIDTLVKGMEDNRDDMIVILAGYTVEMKEFLTANSGLKSRFPNIIEFPDYTSQELLDITKILVKSKGYRLAPECDEKLLSYFDVMRETGDPRTNGNGRMARNKVEEAILSCSRRAVKDSGANLELLLPEDFQ